MNGIIIIDKPSAWTSHDVVAKLRGALKVKRVGHGGTLDPMATGVLPIFTGRATRAAEFCENADKEYIAGLRLGIVTDTQDITGAVIGACDAVITASELADILPRFLGAQNQIPPMYSAIKQNGKKLYELARRGVDVTRAPRGIVVSEIELIGTQDNDFTLRIACSKGTYVRTLCHDIGHALGCGGTLSSLRRTKSGAFTIDMAHTLDSVLDAISAGGIDELLIAVDAIFSDYPAITLSEDDARKFRSGTPCDCCDLPAGKYRLFGPDNEFLLIGEADGSEITVIKRFFDNSYH